MAPRGALAIDEGEIYALDRAHRGAKVEVLEAPAAGLAGDVRMRFLGGVKSGEEAVLPKRVLTARWANRRRGHSSRGPAWAPQSGDQVIWGDPDATWTVVRTAAASGEAVLRHTTLGVLATHVAPISAPRPATRDSRTGASAAADSHTEPPPRRFAVATPRRRIDALLDDMFFSANCLAQYEQTLGGATTDDPATSLRHEISRNGFLVARNSGEYGRLRGLGRFDVVPPSRPRPEDPLQIDKLLLPRRSSGRARQRENAQPRKKSRDQSAR